MKTNLTTKQIKKIQNGKLAIFKDIDTADAREYLLLFLNCKFPNDKSTEKGKTICIKENKIFIGFGDGRWGFDRVEDNSLPIIPLSQIMYTYNPEKFEAKSMPCTQEQWNNDLKPVVEAFGLNVYKYISDCFEYTHSKEYFLTNSSDDGTISYHSRDLYKSVNGKLLPTYSPTEFLEACGIVRVDKEQETVITIKTFDTNTATMLGYIITEDQIKTARTNPETLEKIFPKVFEKPVVEVGKWYRNGDTSHKKSVAFLTDYNKSTNHYKGYGFDIDGNWGNGNGNYVWGSSNWIEATLSDLKPLFEAEFNKRYKEGDLLENVDDSDKSNFKASDIMYHLFNGHPQICSNCISIFYNGNFAKVIKSAELIKAEQELEQAKNKVESLKNK